MNDLHYLLKALEHWNNDTPINAGDLKIIIQTAQKIKQRAEMNDFLSKLNSESTESIH